MLIKAGTPAPFNYSTFDFATGLDVAAKVYDTTSGLPGTLVTTIGMTESLIQGVYLGKFTGTAGKTYNVIKAVYTSNSYTTIDTTRPPDTDDYQCEDIASTGAQTVPVAAQLAMEIQVEEIV